jgi:hypothetical protein
MVFVLMDQKGVGIEINPEYLGWGLEASKRVWAESERCFHVLWADASAVGHLPNLWNCSWCVSKPKTLIDGLI